MNKRWLASAAAMSLGLMGVGCDNTMNNNDSGMMTVEPCTTGTDVEVSANIAADTTWCAVDTYILTDKIFVTDGATLTIEAGTTILGETSSALLVTRGAQLVAEGTAAAPIVFTSANPEGSRATGDWGGVVLMGSAKVNKGSCVNDGDTGTPDVCDAPGYLEGHIEGIDVADANGAYGGNDDAGSCGSLQYVRIEFAGEEFSPDNELNGLTVGACGSASNLSYIQVHRGKDDGIEFFGGTVGMDHVVITGASDDSLDCDLGWTGHVQYLVLHQFEGIGDNGIECDNNGDAMDAEPRTQPEIWNATMIGTTVTRGMVLREGVGGFLHNFLITDFGTEPVDVRDEATALLWPTGLTIEDSYIWNNGPYKDESAVADNDDAGFIEQTNIEDAARNNDVSTDLMMADNSATGTDGTTPDYAPGVATPGATPSAGFDVSATFAGAVANGGTDWTAGWTAYPVD